MNRLLLLTLALAGLLAQPARAQDTAHQVQSLLPGNYQVKYWEIGEGRRKAPGSESMTVTAQGSVYAVTWSLGNSTIAGIGLTQVDELHHTATFSVGYQEEGEIGVIVYDVRWDSQSVRLTNGHWTSAKARQVGCEEATRRR